LDVALKGTGATWKFQEAQRAGIGKQAKEAGYQIFGTPGQ